MKIEKLEGELDKMNRSAVIPSNENNLSMSRNNVSALDLSTNRVVEEKSVLERKYQKLKEDYLKLKSAYEQLKKNQN